MRMYNISKLLLASAAVSLLAGTAAKAVDTDLSSTAKPRISSNSTAPNFSQLPPLLHPRRGWGRFLHEDGRSAHERECDLHHRLRHG